MTNMGMIEPTSSADELKALSRIVAIFEKLDRATQDRAVGWLFDRYRLAAEPAVEAPEADRG